MSATDTIRPPAVAGTFYPVEPDDLGALVDQLLDDADPRASHVTANNPPGDSSPSDSTPIKALIVPHAGLSYSGPVAAHAYAHLRSRPPTVQRVVLVAPAHRQPVRTMAMPAASYFATPLGTVPIDDHARQVATAQGGVVVDDRPHHLEHAIEVQLPFLQRLLVDRPWQLVPVLVGGASTASVADLLTALWGGPETLVVVSTDLSHFHDQPTAERLDTRTVEAITRLDTDALDPHAACGAAPLRGLLEVCRRRGLSPVLLDRRTSADTAGHPERVVGYASFVVDQPVVDPCQLSDSVEAHLLGAARAALAARLQATPPQPQASTSLSPLDKAVLDTPAATFVTLRDSDRTLLGCIGSIQPKRGLADDVVHNALAAGFDDPRMPALRAEQLGGLTIAISVLSPWYPLGEVHSPGQLARLLTPGVHGVLIDDGTHRATLLPSVWEQFGDAVALCDALWRKAGLSTRRGARGLRAWTYTTTEFSD